MVFNGIAIPSRNHMETLRSNFEYRQIPQYHQILGIANRTHFIHNTVKYPRRPLVITVGIKYRWIPLAILNTQIIFFLNVFSSGHEAATKDGDHRHLFESIHCIYLNKSHQNTNILATTVGNQILSNTQVFDGI